MKNAHVALAAALVCAPALALALSPVANQELGGDGRVVVEPYQITVTKEPALEGIETFATPGLALKVAIHVPNKPFLDVVDNALEVRSFVDSTGRDLEAGMEGGFFHGVRLGSRFDDADMSKGTLEISTETLPAADASSITFDGSAYVLSARDPLDDSASVTFKKGTKLTLAGIELEISDVEAVDDGWGDAVQQISLQSKVPLTAIQEWSILDAEGNAVEFDDRGSGSFTFGNSTTYTQSLGPHRALESGILRVNYFATLEHVEVPLRFELGLGL